MNVVLQMRGGSLGSSPLPGKAAGKCISIYPISTKSFASVSIACRSCFVYAPVKRRPIILPKEEEAVDLTVPNTDTVDEAVVPLPKAPKLGVLVEPKIVGFATWLTPRLPNAEAEPEGVPNVNLPADEGWLVEPNNAMAAKRSYNNYQAVYQSSSDRD